ncbi:MAG TPA: hypothetical protein DCZ63_15185 [Geobacter sp.]|nr:hypothetical protein [Geobacter sp.]
MFITGMYAGNIAHYTLSTPWSLETLVYVRKKVINPGGTSSPRCLYFTPDGTKLFVGYYSGGVAMFLLPTPWDINSISLAAAVVVHDPDVTARAYSIWISPDGGKLYLYSDYSNKLFIGTMATPWDLSTVSWVMDADMGPDGVLGVTGYYPYNGIFCNPSESRLFVTGTNSGAAIFTLFGSVPAGRFWTNFKNLREEA